MINDLTRHQLFLQRHYNAIFKEVSGDLKKLRDKLSQKILSATSFQQERLSILIKDIDILIDEHVTKITPSLFENFAEYEQEWTLNLLDKSTVSTVVIGAGIAPEQLKALIATTPMSLNGEAETIDSLIKTFSSRMKKDIKNEITLGIAAGDTTDQIVKSIASMSNGRTKEQAKSVVLTIANHAGNIARQSVWNEYNDLFVGDEVCAVLDSRTTFFCISEDGKVYPHNHAPHFPHHYRCRTVVCPKIKPEYDLDIDTTRSSVDGPVSSKLTYSGWLRKQSKEVQDEVLGVSRAKLFRSGKVTLDSFVDDSGRTYTLEQLKQKDLLK